ncbi:hypothetical protein D9C73_002776 [Collichthys lucidus]|uniref:EGF-like domain-containing protein n=1 Tax=Collichthys lucidus TaxID=240159 RepID=A0A4U5U3I9_COLLU|nr:hypothetical protein D9C73_002776 [Collichthys lucidus]
MPTVPVSTQGTSRWGRGAAQTTSDPSDSTVHPEPPPQHDAQNHELKPTTSIPAPTQSNVEEASTHPQETAASLEDRSGQSLSEEESAVGKERMEVSEASDQLPSSSELEKTEQTHPHPNMVEPLSDHRRKHHLFEVAVEVNFSQDSEESWDDLARSLLLSVKALISEQLEALRTQLSMSPKRIKRLNAGVLYILWLQIGQGPGGPQVHRAIHSAIQGLIATDVSIRGIHKEALIISVSTADVNECETQLMLCDINADCVNQFGSYSCHCRPGFQDESRLGSGGTVCVDVRAAGCSSSLSAETKGVYVLFFLLSSLILMLLAAAGMLYHRHHQGAFLVRCHSGSISPPDLNNKNNNRYHDNSFSSPADSDLPPPPPPPPARGFREGWPQVKERCPAVDLQLLRFSPLLLSDSYIEPKEDGKK